MGKAYSILVRGCIKVIFPMESTMEKAKYFGKMGDPFMEGLKMGFMKGKGSLNGLTDKFTKESTKMERSMEKV